MNNSLLVAMHHFVSSSLFYHILEAFAVVVVAYLSTMMFKKFYRTLRHNSELKSIYKILIYALKVPIKLLIWGVCAFYLIFIVNRFLKFHISDSLLLIQKTLFIALIAVFLLRALHQYELHLKRRYKETHVSIAILCRVLKIIAIVFSVIAIIQTIGIDISGLLAFSSVGGLILGFASKDLLANFFGATLIYLDKTFEVGDCIHSSDKNIEGVVESISWRLTKVRTFDKRPLYVPNSIFNSIVVENTSRMSHRKIQEKVRIRYADIGVAKSIISEIKSMLKNHAEIAVDQTILVDMQFGEDSLDIILHAFAKTILWEEYNEIKQDILFKINEIIESNQAQIHAR